MSGEEGRKAVTALVSALSGVPPSPEACSALLWLDKDKDLVVHGLKNAKEGHAAFLLALFKACAQLESSAKAEAAQDLCVEAMQMALGMLGTRALGETCVARRGRPVPPPRLCSFGSCSRPCAPLQGLLCLLQGARVAAGRAPGDPPA
jgi:hypothetical protein